VPSAEGKKFTYLTASSAKIPIVVKGLPQIVQGALSWLGTGVNENADFGIELTADRVEKPTMGVDLFRVLLLQAKYHLDRDQVCFGVTVLGRYN
jgi:hypothetical protein